MEHLDAIFGILLFLGFYLGYRTEGQQRLQDLSYGTAFFSAATLCLIAGTPFTFLTLQGDFGDLIASISFILLCLAVVYGLICFIQELGVAEGSLTFLFMLAFIIPFFIVSLLFLSVFGFFPYHPLMLVGVVIIIPPFIVFFFTDCWMKTIPEYTEGYIT